MKAFGIASLLLASACRPPCPTLPHTDADVALASHRRARAPARAVRAEARVEQWGRQGRIRGTVMMFVETPNRVRFDAMTQFGPAAILTSDGENFALTDLRENRYLEGPTCPENIARLLGIPMSSADVSLFLLGDTPTIEAATRRIECNGRGNYVATLEGADGRRQEIEFGVIDEDRAAPPDQQDLRLVRSEVFAADGSREWKASFGEYRETEEVALDPAEAELEGLDPNAPRSRVAMPYEVRFEDPRNGADTLVRFRSIDLNVIVPEEAFHQTPRAGIEVEAVPCDASVEVRLETE